MIQAPARTVSDFTEWREKAAGQKFCAIIPVYNSEKVIGDTLRRTVETFESYNLDYEIVCVNDCSNDGSWHILQHWAAMNPRVTAINLVRNAGQHAAILCGLANSSADFYITLDDDLQNPPEEMIHLIAKTQEGFDFVCGRFRQKKHVLYRRLGTRLIYAINERIFGIPKGYALTNFRIIDRALAERIVSYRTTFPYITGQAALLASRIGNVDVEHHERTVGKSNYSLVRIARIVFTILFNYSSLPLRFVCGVGVLISAISFLFGSSLVVRSLYHHVNVAGWTTIVVLLSFYSGFMILMLGMIGEYLIRILGTTSERRAYYIKETMRHGKTTLTSR